MGMESSTKWIECSMIRKMASSPNAEDIIKSLRIVIDNVQKAVERRPSHLPPINPRLVAVSKTKPISDIITAYSQGQRHFGENYVQELEEKATSSLILEQCQDIKWHLIGHLQRNKSNKIACLPNLFMIETVDSAKLAQTLNNHWEKLKRQGKLFVMVQVNTSGECNKSGCNPDEISTLVTFIRTKCPHLTFSGLMTIGAIGYDPSAGPNPDFLKLVKCREDLCKELNLSLDEVELSMGMSSDYEHAIELGSSNVRVGSTIFGARGSANTNQSTPAADSPECEPLTSVTYKKSTKTNDSSSSSKCAGDSQDTDSTNSLRDGLERIDLDVDKST